MPRPWKVNITILHFEMFFLGISSRASLFNTRAAAYYCYLTVSLTFLDNLFIYGKKFVFYDKRISFPFTLNKKPWVFAVDNGCRWVEFSTRYFRRQKFPLSYERAGLLLMTWQRSRWLEFITRYLRIQRISFSFEGAGLLLIIWQQVNIWLAPPNFKGTSHDIDSYHLQPPPSQETFFFVQKKKYCANLFGGK